MTTFAELAEELLRRGARPGGVRAAVSPAIATLLAQELARFGVHFVVSQLERLPVDLQTMLAAAGVGGVFGACAGARIGLAVAGPSGALVGGAVGGVIGATVGLTAAVVHIEYARDGRVRFAVNAPPGAPA